MLNPDAICSQTDLVTLAERAGSVLKTQEHIKTLLVIIWELSGLSSFSSQMNILKRSVIIVMTLKVSIKWLVFVMFILMKPAAIRL